jgi:hypothetical protein
MTEARKQILKVHEHRKHRKKSVPINIIYKWAKESNLIPEISSSTYSKIIRAVNKVFVNNFLETGDIKFPHKAGKLILLKSKPTIKTVNGKLYNNYSIDWDKTLTLWEKDPEARSNKTLLKKITPYLYGILYAQAKYNNSDFYKFYPNREFRNKVRKALDDNTLDGYKIHD